MSLAKVRHRGSDEHLEIVGRGRILPHDAGLVANRIILEPVGMSSLRTALCHYKHWMGGFPDVLATPLDEELIDDECQVDESRLVWHDEKLMAQTFVPAEGRKPTEEFIASVLATTLQRERMQLAEVSIWPEKWGWSVYLTLEVPLRGQSVGVSLDRADMIGSLLQIALNGGFDSGSAAALVHAGHARLLIGSFENEWLDAKSAPYRLDEPGSYELCKDVAAFANAEGGIVVIGAKTKKTPEGDRIRSINECLAADVPVRKWLATVEKRVFPKVDGLSVDFVPGNSRERGVAMIHIPRQKEIHKPFLVTGTRNGDRVSELGFTYAIREGEGTRAPRIDILHQLIRAGQGVIGESQALSEVAQVRADVDRLALAAWENWLQDIVAATQAEGFLVERDRGFVVFRRGDNATVRVQAAQAPPPADLVQRQRLLERLADLGLKVHTNPKGFLQLGPASWELET